MTHEDNKVFKSLSEPSNYSLILHEPTEPIQEVGGCSQKTKGIQHLQVGLVRNALKLQVDVLAHLRKDVGCEDEADNQRNN